MNCKYPEGYFLVINYNVLLGEMGEEGLCLGIWSTTRFDKLVIYDPKNGWYRKRAKLQKNEHTTFIFL